MESKAWIPMMKPSSISTWKLKARGAGGAHVFCFFVGDLVQNIGISNCRFLKGHWIVVFEGFQVDGD